MTKSDGKQPKSDDAAVFTSSGNLSPSVSAEGKSPKQLVAAAKRGRGYAWIGLTNPSPSEVEELADALDLPVVAARDAAIPGQQPKVQFFGQTMVVVLWTLRPTDNKLRYETVETYIVATDHVLVTVQYGDPEADSIRSALEEDVPGAVGVVGGAYKVMARAALHYTEATHHIEQELEELEDQVFNPSTADNARRIYGLRRHIGRVTRAVSGITRSLERTVDELALSEDSEDTVRPYLRDLLDDLVGTQQLAADQDKALDGIIATHENGVASQQNRDARRVSAVAALIAAPAVIAGIYGMNFKNLPGVDWQYGWLAVMAGIAVVVACMAFYFKRVHWL